LEGIVAGVAAERTKAVQDFVLEALPHATISISNGQEIISLCLLADKASSFQ
jgi:hypothetical protein